MKKRIILILLCTFFLPFAVNAKSCDSSSIKLKSIELNTTNGNVQEVNEASISNKKINLNLKLYDPGDSIEYNIKVKNTSKENYYFDEKSLKLSTDYLEYEFICNDNSNIVEAGKEKTIKLRVEYKNDVPAELLDNNKFNDLNTMNISLSNKKVTKGLGTLKNPKTGSYIVIYLTAILTISVIIYIILKNKKTNKLMILIIGTFIIIPYTVYAVCSFKIELETRVQIISAAKYPEGKNKASVVTGDIVKIGTEEFYVVSNDGKDLVLLAHYNLKVGNIYTIYGNRVTKIGEYTNEDDGYGFQSSETRGYIGGENDIRKGTIDFSNSIYWRNNVGEGLQYSGDFCDYTTYTPGMHCAYIYDSNSITKQYVDAYQRALEETGVRIKESRLLKVEEAYALGCGNGTKSCKVSPANAPAWVYETTYWLGSAFNNQDTWFIVSTGQFGDYYNNDNMYGIRPVIVI